MKMGLRKEGRRKERKKDSGSIDVKIERRKKRVGDQGGKEVRKEGMTQGGK